VTIKLVEPAPGSSQDRRRGERRLDFGNAWDYAAAPETPDHVRLQKRYELFIDGKWQEPASGKYFDTVSPSTEEKIAEVAEANEADVNRAVEAARRAYEQVWSRMKPLERG
jgi:aldehyde dehydrogenase (NAD+)